MNTPAHVVVNLVTLGRRRPDADTLPVLAGALLPDIPMFLFYAVEKAAGRPESSIWGEAYYQPFWSAVIDSFNSLPIIAAGLAIGLLLRSRAGILLFASMALHIAFDLPLHHDDAHRHLFPFSHWKFESPVSYWDPAHFGRIVAPLEILSVAAGSFVLWKGDRRRSMRWLIGIILAFYVAYFVYAVTVWT